MHTWEPNAGEAETGLWGLLASQAGLTDEHQARERYPMPPQQHLRWLSPPMQVHMCVPTYKQTYMYTRKLIPPPKIRIHKRKWALKGVTSRVLRQCQRRKGKHKALWCDIIKYPTPLNLPGSAAQAMAIFQPH